MNIAWIRRALLAASVCLLGACGGGGTSSPQPATTALQSDEVPASVTQSVASLIQWASTLPATETGEPLLTDTFHPPVDDSAQPIPIGA